MIIIICKNFDTVVIFQLLRQIILENKFYFVDTKVGQLSRNEAEKFYIEHKSKLFFHCSMKHFFLLCVILYLSCIFFSLDKFFYNRLVTFMSR